MWWLNAFRNKYLIPGFNDVTEGHRISIVSHFTHLFESSYMPIMMRMYFFFSFSFLQLPWTLESLILQFSQENYFCNRHGESTVSPLFTSVDDKPMKTKFSFHVFPDVVAHNGSCIVECMFRRMSNAHLRGYKAINNFFNYTYQALLKIKHRNWIEERSLKGAQVWPREYDRMEGSRRQQYRVQNNLFYSCVTYRIVLLLSRYHTLMLQNRF
jgi:hypothetical protein